MTRATAAEVMIEHNSKLARNPAHLRRLIAFWPEENIVHQLAKQALEDMDCQKMITDIDPCITDNVGMITDSEGWVLVPLEPTRQMMSQGHFAMAGTDRGKFRRIYQAMIKAAQEIER